jgi:hypothetical protein
LSAWLIGISYRTHDKAHRVTLFCSGNQAFMFLNAQFF